MAPRKPLVNLFTMTGHKLIRAGKNGSAFIRKLNPFTGKMEKKYGRKAVSRSHGVVNSMNGIPMANRPKKSTLNRLRK